MNCSIGALLVELIIAFIMQQQNILKKKNIKISTEGVGNHERLWNTFIQNGKNDMILKAIGNDGTKLRIKRNIYHVPMGLVQSLIIIHY